MTNTAEKLVTKSKATLEAAQTLATKGHAHLEKLIDLNMATSKKALGESFAHAKAVLSAKDAQEVAALQANLVKPLTEKSATYAQNFQKIIPGANTEFTKAAQSSMADVHQEFETLMENVTKNAPAGTESAIAFFNNVMTASQSAFISAQSSAKIAVEAAQANFTETTAQAVDAVKKASKTA